jgi:hypothetical protein
LVDRVTLQDRYGDHAVTGDMTMTRMTEAEAIEYATKLAPEVDSRPMTVISARRSHDDDDGYVVMTSIGRCDVWRLPNGQLYGEF